MRVVVAGGSGFLGSRVRRRLANDGHDVVQLVRRPPANDAQRQWWPERHELDPAALTGADAVINLAGRGVEDKRWNDEFKQVLLSSRVDPTTTLATALAALPDGERPRVLLNASAIGFYGDTGDTPVDESSPPGTGYFPNLCQQWEAATVSATEAGVRVTLLRTGLVLDGGGGLLRPILLAYRLFAGGPMAGGRQWMPWISMRDWVSATMFLLAHDIAGPVNLVGPDPVRNADFSRAVARAVHRPAIIPLPKVALKALLGEFANEAVASQRVLPTALNQAGFTFTDTDVDAALAAALRRN